MLGHGSGLGFVPQREQLKVEADFYNIVSRAFEPVSGERECVRECVRERVCVLERDCVCVHVTVCV